MALEFPPPIPYPGMGAPVTGGGSGKVKTGGVQVLATTTGGYMPDGSKAIQHHTATVNVHGLQFAVKADIPASGDAVGEAMAADAKSRSGPYIAGGVGQEFTRNGKNVIGYDCSGFNIALLSKAGCAVKGRWLPHSAEGQMRLGKPVKQKDLQPGDLVFFKDKDGNIKHTGVFLGWIKNKDGSPKLDCHGQPMMRIMHASDHKQKMKVTDEKDGYNESTRYYAGARRVRPDDDISKEQPIVKGWYRVRKAENKLEAAQDGIAAAEKALKANPPEAQKLALQAKIKALQDSLPDLQKKVTDAKANLKKMEGEPEY